MLMRKHPVKRPNVFPAGAFSGARRTLRSQHGVGLVELLIASAIGLFLLAGLTDFLGRSLTSSGRNLQDARLTQDLNVAMELITRDLRRAGYSGTAQGVTTAAGAEANPFMQAVGSTGMSYGGINLSQSDCILYSYDLSTAALGIGVLDPAENLGFRLRSGAVEAGSNVTTCDLNVITGWQQVTDPKLSTITALSFEFLDSADNVAATPFANPPGPNWVVCTRLIRVTLTGQLRNTPAVTRTLIQSVRVRNDWYRTGTTTCT
jgi:prepilin peptidase dependent protein B